MEMESGAPLLDGSHAPSSPSCTPSFSSSCTPSSPSSPPSTSHSPTSSSNATTAPSNPALDFSVLSPAILELIINYLNGYDIMALYRTHSSALLLRMRFGGVRRLEMSREDVEPSWHYSFFAALTHFPHLHSISISNPLLPIWRSGWTLLEHLPPSVTSISLQLPVDLGSWLLISRKESHATRQKKAAEHATKYYYRNQGWKSTDYFPKYDIKTILPNLSSLRIGLTPISVANSLVRYDQESREKAVQVFSRSLPATLTRLQIPRQTSPDFTKSKLPILHSLTIQYAEQYGLSLGSDDWARLPPHLTQLDLIVHTATISSLQGLPPLIRTFSLSREKYTVDAQLFGGLIGRQMVHMTLDLGSSICTNSFISLLPATLEYFKLAAATAPPLVYRDLPKNLTELIVDVSKPNAFSDALSLPPNLLHLTLQHGFPISSVDFMALPRTLQTITLGLAVGPLALHIPSECASSLPESLRSLRIRNSLFTSEFADCLPSDLTHLEFVTTTPFGSSALHLLPPSLTDLTVDAKQIMHGSALSALPSHLTRLYVISGSLVLNSIISDLPRSLLHLSILNNNTLNDDCLADLPPNLRTLELPQNGQLTVLCAGKLPKSLQILLILKITMIFPAPPKAELMSSFPSALKVYGLPWYTKKNRKFDLFAMKS